MPYSDPGYVSDVNGGDAIDPDWGNAVRDRVVHHFASAAARDAAITAPTEGMACFLADVDQLLVYRGTAWTPPWNLPWGQIARTELTGGTINVAASAVTDVTGLSVTWTAVAGRLYEVRASVGLFATSSGTPSTSKLLITDNANTVKGVVINTVLSASGTGSRTAGERSVFASGLSAGSTTWKARAQCAAGSIDIGASATDPGPAWISVRDIGPA